MKTAHIFIISLVVILASVSPTYAASKKPGKGNSSGNNKGGSSSSNSSDPNGCPVVGIKATGVFYRANQRSCFANATKAGKKGFEAASSDSTLRGFSFALTGTEEVPAVTTTATGSCLAALLADNTTLQVICTHTVASPTAAHIHSGAIGVDGDIVCDLGNGVSPIAATCTLTTTVRDSLLNGDLYVNVHSQVSTGGELRGQID